MPLGYEKWENFSKVIDKAMLACDVAGFDIKDHFPGVRKMVEIGSEEMIANLFRISQTQSKITRESIGVKNLQVILHFTVGKEVREAIIRLGGVMPEDLPTPQKGIVELEREAIKKLKEKNKEIMTDE